MYGYKYCCAALYYDNNLHPIMKRASSISTHHQFRETIQLHAVLRYQWSFFTHAKSLMDPTQHVCEKSSCPMISCCISENRKAESVNVLMDDCLTEYMSSMKGPQVYEISWNSHKPTLVVISIIIILYYVCNYRIFLQQNVCSAVHTSVMTTVI